MHPSRSANGSDRVGRDAVSTITRDPRNAKYLVPARSKYEWKFIGAHVISLDPRWPSERSDRDGSTIWIPEKYETRDTHAETWEEHGQGRELLEGRPVGVYEIVRGRLLANIREDADIDRVVGFLRALAGLAGSAASMVSDADLRAAIAVQRDHGDQVDVTDFLPSVVRDVMFELHRAQRAIQDDRADKAGELQTREYTEQEAVDKLERSQFATDRINAGHFALTCHEFLVMVLANERDAGPGTVAYEAENNWEAILGGASGAGELVPARRVKVGDVAIFRTYRPHYWGTDLELKKHGVVHSALVVRVVGATPHGIELLEKRDPGDFMGTRTVAEVLKDYRVAGVEVVYVRPRANFAEIRRRELGMPPAASP